MCIPVIMPNWAIGYGNKPWWKWQVHIWKKYSNQTWKTYWLSTQSCGEKIAILFLLGRACFTSAFLFAHPTEIQLKVVLRDVLTMWCYFCTLLHLLKWYSQIQNPCHTCSSVRLPAGLFFSRKCSQFMVWHSAHNCSATCVAHWNSQHCIVTVRLMWGGACSAQSSHFHILIGLLLRNPVELMCDRRGGGIQNSRTIGNQTLNTKWKHSRSLSHECILLIVPRIWLESRHWLVCMDNLRRSKHR